MLDSVKHKIDRKIIELEKSISRFKKDPILNSRHSIITTICGSATKRHGHIIEMALRKGLRESGHYMVWKEKAFIVSPLAVSREMLSQSLEHTKRTSLPYGQQVTSDKERDRQLRADIMAYDLRRKSLSASEVKRAHSHHDSGKREQMGRDIRVFQVLLKSYGESRGLEIEKHDSNIICYYGQRDGLPYPWTLSRDEIDEYFETPLASHIDDANVYFAAQIAALLSRVEQSNTIQSDILAP